jgi:hypothetical protein
MPCSPRRRIRFVTVIGGYGFVSPGRVDITSANLAPATGARTTRFCRPFSAVRQRAARSLTGQKPALPSRHTPNAATSTASHPAFVTIAIRPSVGWDDEGYEVIWVGRKTKYFCKWGWTERPNHHHAISPSEVRYRGARVTISPSSFAKEAVEVLTPASYQPRDAFTR